MNTVDLGASFEKFKRELTNYEQWQLEKYGNILQEPDMEIGEPGELEARRFEDWSHLKYELELHDYDKD